MITKSDSTETFLILKHGSISKAIDAWLHNKINLTFDEWYLVCEYISETHKRPMTLRDDIGGRRIQAL